jgi:CDP-6-deoxy-D-xylo-4-hexulose-3-dehydrase
MGYNRAQIIAAMNKSGVEVRPIVAGNFTKNEAMKWFDYSIHGELKNANELDRHGFFIGNHHYPMNEELNLLELVLKQINK